MSNVKIGLVTGLETEDPIAKNFLAHLYDVQPPVGCIVKWDTFELGLRDAGTKSAECAYQGTNLH